MSGHERTYRAFLVAVPKHHRDEYGEPMVQMMRDRLRDEGGGIRSLTVWSHLIADLARTAVRERRGMTMSSFSTAWWRYAAALIAIVLAIVGFDGVFEPASGPWYKWVLGRSAIVAAPLVIAAGLLVRTRHQRNGSLMIAVGVLPGAAAVVLFWSPPFLLFGLLSIAVLCQAADDVDRLHRAARAQPINDATV